MTTRRDRLAVLSILVFVFLGSISALHAQGRPGALVRQPVEGAAALGDPCGGCFDGDDCTIDICNGEVCEYTPIVCDDFDPCTVDSCSGGSCFYEPIVCDDSDPCTVDSCSGGTCVYEPIVCDDDGDACTDDICVGGFCQYVYRDCDDLDPCNGLEGCDSGIGCVGGIPETCDDGNACTFDTCEPYQGCFYYPTDPDSDGVCDEIDNCPLANNPDQSDIDLDSLGDACDPCPESPENDQDHDGYCGGDDNCPTVYNPEQGDQDEDGVGDVCTPVKVNFGPPESEVPEGFLFDDGSPFDPYRHYGWTGQVSWRERGQEIPQELDTFIFSRDLRHWIGEVPNGEYDVRVVGGDASYPQGPQRVLVNGIVVTSDELSAAGAFVDRAGRVSVRNGRLDMAIGGTEGNTIVNLVEINPAAAGPEFMRSINFEYYYTTYYGGTPAGFEADYGYPYDDETGYGWDDYYEGVSQESSAPTVLSTFVGVYDYGTWEMAVPGPGYYDVWLAVGDSLEAAGPHRVWVENRPVVLSELTEPGKPIERRTGARVEDGRLTLGLGESWGEESARRGGGSNRTQIHYVVVASAADDADGDGLLNEVDICPFDADAAQTDSDEDGDGDACDPDRDGDGWENPADVCDDAYDPGQEDADGDGRGDVCDVCPLDRYDDVDGDTVCGLSDNCREVSNPGQEDENGDGLGDACSVLRVNFGPPTSPAVETYQEDHGAPFDPFLKRGWDAWLNHRDRRTAAAQELDTFVFSDVERWWRAELPNGDYLVRASLGDVSYAQGPERVAVQGEDLFFDTYLDVNQFEERSTTARVRNGRLEVAIGNPMFEVAAAGAGVSRAVAPEIAARPVDDGGVDGAVPASGYTTLNWIEATPLPAPPGLLLSFNFQPAGSEAPYGVQVDSGATFDSEDGYGWSAAVPSRDRATRAPQMLDTFVFSSVVRLWEAEVPNGNYLVHLAVGDARYDQGPQRVLVEGQTAVDGEFTAAGSFIERTVAVTVEDGRLTLEVGGGGGNTCLNYVTIETAPEPN